MGMPAARITDLHTCSALAAALVVPPAGGPIITGMMTVITGGMPQARITDNCACAAGTDMIIKGSPTVLVGGLPAARIGDNTLLGGVIFTGFFTVLIGDTGGGGGGGGGGGPSGDADPSAMAASSSGMADPPGQAKALTDAARTGAPFVQRC